MLRLEKKVRERLWQRVNDVVEEYLNGVQTHPVASSFVPEEIRGILREWDFDEPMEASDAVDRVVRLLRQHQTHVSHPRYYGLFNPAPSTMGIAADTLVAAFNPQLATWVHCPIGVEMEQHLLRRIGRLFGYREADTGGSFTSCGSEANHTAVLAALAQRFPDVSRRGLRVLTAQPVLYGSTESHYSLEKAARQCGLGAEAVHRVPVDGDLKMRAGALCSRIREDRTAGLEPFLVMATAGTTSAGVIDPLPDIARVAEQEGLWMHVDAAWGGAAAFVPELRHLLDGCERADSITLDAHKWLSMPMAAGMILTRRPRALWDAFQMDADYLPPRPEGVTEPLATSMQGSRRLIGLKLFLTLAVAGWDTYARTLRHQVDMGHLLRRSLGDAGWNVINKTELPLVCFVDPADGGEAHLKEIARRVVSSGEAWISTARIGGRTPVLRACITNFRTQAEDIAALIAVLDRARRATRTL